MGIQVLEQQNVIIIIIINLLVFFGGGGGGRVGTRHAIIFKIRPASIRVTF